MYPGRLISSRTETNSLNPTKIASVCRRNDGNEQNRAGNSAKEKQMDIIHVTGLSSSPGREKCVRDGRRGAAAVAPAGTGRTSGSPQDLEEDNGDGVSGTGGPRGHLRCRTPCRLRPPRGGARLITHRPPANLIAQRPRRPAGTPRAPRVAANRRCHPLEGAAGRLQNAPQPGADIRPGRGLRRQRPRRVPQGPPRNTADAPAAA